MVAQSRGEPFIDAMADKLEEIFKMQETLNKRIGVETAGMTEEEKVKWTSTTSARCSRRWPS
jgi:hypothetical protein